MITTRNNILYLLLFCLAGMLASCVNDKKTDGCARPEPGQGLLVTVYSQTRCQDEPTWPENPGRLTLFVFNENDILVAQRSWDEIPESEYFSATFDLPEGLYSIVGWTGIDSDHFAISRTVEGETTKSDLLLRLNRTGETAVSTEGLVLLTGESRPVYVHAAENEDRYREISVNLLEITNRIDILVEGLPLPLSDYSITISSDNGSMNIDGTVADDRLLIYTGRNQSSDSILRATFTILKLETGKEYWLEVTENESGTELYRGSLLGALILKNPYVNLDCEHDFTIMFTAEDQCDCGTYAITEIWVNNWLVHSYGTDF